MFYGNRTFTKHALLAEAGPVGTNCFNGSLTAY
jgi:hypothetical protein